MYMKKLLALFVFIMFFTLTVFGQSIGDIEFNTLFATLQGVASGSVIITALINKWLKIDKGWIKQLISWTVPTLIITVGNLLNIGFMADFGWFATLSYGLGAGLISNGIFDFVPVQKYLKWLNLK